MFLTRNRSTSIIDTERALRVDYLLRRPTIMVEMANTAAIVIEVGSGIGAKCTTRNPSVFNELLATLDVRYDEES